jgi:hypothetical protein
MVERWQPVIGIEMWHAHSVDTAQGYGVNLPTAGAGLERGNMMRHSF